MEKFEYGSWKLDGDCFVLPNRKFRIKSITEIYFKPSENEGSQCSLVVIRNDEKYEFSAPSELQEETLKIGENIANELHIPIPLELPEEEKNRIENEQKARKEAEEKARVEAEAEEKAQRNREKATQTLKKVVSLNEGIKQNEVAANSKKTAKIFEEWADRAYKLILIVTTVLCIVAVIAGFVLLVSDSDGVVIFFSVLGGAIVWFFINYIDAIFIRFILRCIAQNYYAQAEVVQNTYISANVALYSANNTEE